MNGRTLLPVLAVLLLLTLPSALSQEHPRVVREAYVAPAWGLQPVVAFYLGCEDATNAGGVCVRPQAGETEATVSILDLSGQPVLGLVFFMREDHDQLAPAEWFCGGGTFDLPAGTQRLVVNVQDAARSLTSCGSAPRAQGDVEVMFWS